MKTITLYHGTSDINWKGIKNQGLRHPYLTNSLDLAEYYAEVTVEEVGGKPIVLAVKVDPSFLRYDGNAMEEPVAFDD